MSKGSQRGGIRQAGLHPFKMLILLRLLGPLAMSRIGRSMIRMSRNVSLLSGAEPTLLSDTKSYIGYCLWLLEIFISINSGR